MGYVGRLGVHIGCAKGVSDVDVCPLIGLVVVLAALFVVVGGLMVAGGAIALSVPAFPMVAVVVSVVGVVVVSGVGRARVVRVVVLVASNHLRRRGCLGIGTCQVSRLMLLL